MQIIRHASLIATPWKNGGGTTREAVRMPAGDGPFRWRLSVASIDRAGPFSNFSDYHRTMVLLDGRGLRLTFGADESSSLTRIGDMVEFDGALKTECHLIDGPCIDLNLMVSKSMPRAVSVSSAAVVERLRQPRVLQAPRSGTSLVFCLMGRLSVIYGDDSAVDLEPWDLAVLPAGGECLRLGFDLGSSPLVFFATLDDNSL